MAGQAVDPPCRSRPQPERCDRHGPGGFMGHTCYPTTQPREQAGIDLDKLQGLARAAKAEPPTAEAYMALACALSPTVIDELVTLARQASTTRQAAPEAPTLAPNAEAIQWRNIQKVLREVAEFCFGSADDKTYGSSYIAVVNSLTAKDGLDVKLEPLRTSTGAAPKMLTVQEVWLAAGGNPGIIATKQDALDALKMMDAAVDECDGKHGGAAPEAPDSEQQSATWESLHMASVEWAHAPGMHVVGFVVPNDDASTPAERLRRILDATPAATTASTLEQYLAGRAAKTPTSTEGFVTGTGAAPVGNEPDIYDAVRDYRDRHPESVAPPTNPTE